MPEGETHRPATTPAGARRRFCLDVLGDSIAEGLGDPGNGDAVMGFGDRLATMISAYHGAPISYSNLAIRGMGVEDALGRTFPGGVGFRPGRQLATVLGRAEREGPADLTVVHVGGNDVTLTGFDADRIAADYEKGIRMLRATGTSVVMVAIPDLRRVPVLRLGNPKCRELNRRLERIAAEHGCTFVATWKLPALRDPRSFSVDRLHYGIPTHDLLARQIAKQLGYGSGSITAEYPHLLPYRGFSGTLSWVKEYLLPSLGRMVTGRNIGDGREPKYPERRVWGSFRSEEETRVAEAYAQRRARRVVAGLEGNARRLVDSLHEAAVGVVGSVDRMATASGARPARRSRADGSGNAVPIDAAVRAAPARRAERSRNADGTANPRSAGRGRAN